MHRTGMDMPPLFKIGTDVNPSWRKPAGVLGILLIILVWAIGVASLSAWVGSWPGIAQGIFYLIAGIAWILPLKPLLLWMETGAWKLPD
jgi:Protein of unknown function (DUF2842)